MLEAGAERARSSGAFEGAGYDQTNNEIHSLTSLAHRWIELYPGLSRVERGDCLTSCCT